MCGLNYFYERGKVAVTVGSCEEHEGDNKFSVSQKLLWISSTPWNWYDFGYTSPKFLPSD